MKRKMRDAATREREKRGRREEKEEWRDKREKREKKVLQSLFWSGPSFIGHLRFYGRNWLPAVRHQAAATIKNQTNEVQ